MPCWFEVQFERRRSRDYVKDLHVLERINVTMAKRELNSRGTIAKRNDVPRAILSSIVIRRICVNQIPLTLLNGWIGETAVVSLRR
jgi:hypothetical protein